MKINSINNQLFRSTYTVDTGTAPSRTQVFTLGALMGSGWIYNANTTFNRIRNSGVYATVDIRVKDQKDDSFYSVLRKNNISYEKKLNSNFVAVV